MKLSHEAGALFAGLVLVGTPHVDRAKRAVAPLAALFGGMYVASLGLVVSPRYLQNHASAVVAHVLFVVCVKVAVTAPVVYALGFSKQAAAGAGAVFAQVSEVALFVAARAHHLQLVTRHTYLDVLSTTIVLLAIAPLFIHVLKRVDRKQFLSLDKDTEHRVTATALLLSYAVDAVGVDLLVEQEAAAGGASMLPLPEWLVQASPWLAALLACAALAQALGRWARPAAGAADACCDAKKAD